MEKAVGILGIGSYVPENIVTNLDFEKILDTSDAWIAERTGIRERRFASAAEATSDLAYYAGERALRDAGLSAEDLDLIIVATVTPDMLFPSVACLVQARLGAVNAAAFDLTAVCTGFIYAMITGRAFIQSGMYRRVLVIGAETLSRITDQQDRNTAILFGDGAGAAVLGETDPGYGIVGVYLGAEGAGGDLLKLPAGGSRYPASAETVEKRMHYTYMDGNEVFKFAVKVMGEAANAALKHAGLTAADISCLVPHQANIRIIQSAAKRLKLSMDKVIVNLDRYGNTSAASVPLALDEAIKAGRITKGDVIVLVGFGGGLTWGAAAIKWNKV